MLRLQSEDMFLQTLLGVGRDGGGPGPSFFYESDAARSSSCVSVQARTGYESLLNS